ncbi:unnamed protein product [Moneuplotes crassus]|uniref:AP2/ERF domain-containing protein n=1 Tax=Euplotes crassus TaxID=5936 RepID=A0AAD1XJE2_EUPCR|nr:unnamed protein product [Moneuplotes crassus]
MEKVLRKLDQTKLDSAEDVIPQFNIVQSCLADIFKSSINPCDLLMTLHNQLKGTRQFWAPELIHKETEVINEIPSGNTQKEESKSNEQSYESEMQLRSQSRDGRTKAGKPIKERKRRNAEVNCTKQLLHILKLIDNNVFTGLKARSKSPDCRTKSHNQDRGSKYIGVSKNGNNWQVLITMNKHKTYLGTFTKIQAALVYDFHSIAFNGAKAKVNFTYTADCVRDMINSYFSNGNKFNPQQFEDRVQDQVDDEDSN